MRFAVSLPNVGEPAELVALGRAAESAGWDAVLLWDHMQLLRAASLETADPWVTLGALAQVTSRVRLGTLVTPVARRRPWKLAKEVTTLDRLSGGRAVLGVGLGEPPDDDFAAFGDPADPATRAVYLDEGLVLIDRFLRGEAVAHQGEAFTVAAHLRPGAFTDPRPPIWVAGKWPNPAPLRRAARWDGYAPIDRNGEPLTPDAVAEAAAQLSDGHDLVCTARDDVDAAEYENAGATWLVRSAWPVGDWYEKMARTIAAGPA